MGITITRGPNYGSAMVIATAGVWEWVVYPDGSGAKRASLRSSFIARRFANKAETEANAKWYREYVGYQH